MEIVSYSLSKTVIYPLSRLQDVSASFQIKNQIKSKTF